MRSPGSFNAVTDGSDTSSYLAPNLDESARSLIESTVPEGATPTITAMDQSMTTSTAEVEVELSLGGVQTYTASFVRSSNYIGWTVSALEIDFTASDEADATGEGASTDADGATAGTTGDAADTATDAGASDTAA